MSAASDDVRSSEEHQSTAATQKEVVDQPEKRRRGVGSVGVTTIASRFGLLISWGLVVLIFSILRPATFATAANFQTIFSSQAVLLVLALALLPSLAAGEYDLSVAGMLGLSLVLVGYLNVLHGWPIGCAILAALGAGLVVGLGNVFFIVVIGIDSLVVTLGTGTVLAGAALGINNLSLGGVSANLVNAMRHQIFGLQAAFYYALGLTILLWYVFAYTPLGRYLFFVGAGRNVARLTGIRVDLIRAGALLFASLIAAFAGIMLAGLLGSVDPTIGPTFLLPAFASAFLGATSITPGRFNAWGTFVAVYFLVTGITGLELMGLSGWIEQVFYGGSLVIAVAFSKLAGMRRGERT
jgi:ribose transport system permease protein